MTSSAAPLPKLRVTKLSCGDAAPQSAHWRSAEIDNDDDELAVEAGFDDDFRHSAVERDAGDDALGFAGWGVGLARVNLPREDDVFEVEGGEFVIVKLFGSVG